jgi:hypothetical protein
MEQTQTQKPTDPNIDTEGDFLKPSKKHLGRLISIEFVIFFENLKSWWIHQFRMVDSPTFHGRFTNLTWWIHPFLKI